MTDCEFDQGNAGASITVNVFAGDCNRVGSSLIVLKDLFPCKVIQYSEHKSGKHGSCKCTFKGKDIFTAKVIEECYTSTDTVEKPLVTKTEYACSHVEDDAFLFLIDDEGTQKEDLKLPKEDHL